MSSSFSSFAEKLIFIRGKMSQLEFSRKMDRNPNTVRSYERSDALPNVDFLTRLCTEFDVNPKWLLLGEGLPFNSDYEPSYDFETADDLREEIAQLHTALAESENEIDEKENELDECFEKIDLLKQSQEKVSKEKEVLLGAFLELVFNQVNFFQESVGIQFWLMKIENEPLTEESLTQLKQVLEEFVQRAKTYTDETRNMLISLKKNKESPESD